MGMFQKATKKQLKARIALDGPAGSGKSYTALRFAFALANGGKVAVIDTEHRSASKYQGQSPDGVPFDFDVCELEHYAPSTYTNVIKEAGKGGYDVLIIDSLSHGWEGVGGALDQVDKKAAASKSGNSFTAWRDVTPMHRDMVEAILACPCHVIATMRSKMAYELETDAKGKMKPTKIGLKPIQREGVEYEFDVIGDLDVDHMIIVSKSRCPAIDGARAVKPGGAFIAPLLEWLSTGVAPDPTPKPTPEPDSEPAAKPGGVKLSGKSNENPHEQSIDAPCGQDIADKIVTMAKQLKMPPEKLAAIKSNNGVSKLADLPYLVAAKLVSKLEAMVQEEDIPF